MSKKVKHIYAYGDVVNIQVTDANEFGVICLKSVVEEINSMPDAEQIVVHIHSPGGDVFEGFAIHDALVNTKKEIITIIEGLCGSIATVLALAGTTRKMTKNSKFMIHNPFSFGMGDAEELQKQANLVKDAETQIVDFYHEKTGLDKTKIQDMMSEETFMSPDEAKDFGFITEVVEAPQNKIFAKIQLKPKTKTPDNMSKSKKLLSALTTFLVNQGVIDGKKIELKTKDGKSVNVQTEEEKAKAGDLCDVDGELAVSTSIVLEDDSTIVTDEDGKITEIKPAEEVVEDEDEVVIENKADLKLVNTLKAQAVKDKNEIVKLKAELKKVVEDHETEITEIETLVNVLKKNVKSIHKPEENQTKFRSNGNDKGNKKTGDVSEASERVKNRYKPVVEKAKEF